MPRQIIKTIYTYQELLDLHKANQVTDKALDRARDWLQRGQTMHDWYDAVYDIWKQALAQIGFIDAEISFSGFWSQGDGASFTANIEIDKLADFLASEIKPKDRIEGQPEDFRPWLVHHCETKPIDARYRRLGRIADYCHPCKVRRISHRYSHENTCRVSIEMNHAGRAERVEALLDEFERDAEIIRKSLSKAIYATLEAEYWYLTSDESIMETAAANDYTFTIDGRREG